MKQWLAGLFYSSLLMAFVLVDFVKWIIDLNLAALNAAGLKIRKAAQLKRDWQWGQKFGLLPVAKPPMCHRSNISSKANQNETAHTKTLLIHCASVGEVVASIALLKALVKQNPNVNIVVTTNTLTGKQQLQRSIKNTGLEACVVHNYLPVDLSGLMRRFLKCIQPDLVMIMEVEMWPNFIKQSKKQNIPVVVVNGRMTDKTCAGYQKFSVLSKPMLSNIDYIYVRNSGDLSNYQKLSMSPDKLELVGNIKFDIELPSANDAQKLRDSMGLTQRTVIVAGSTHEGEEQALIDCFHELHKTYNNLLLFIAPRHPHRFDHVHQRLIKQNLQVVRMSQQASVDASTQVLLGDEMGKLSQWYGVADVVFIGGSLVKRGGHNPIEAAAFAKPVIMGQYIYNNPEIIQTLANDGGLVLIDEESELLTQLTRLLSDMKYAKSVGICGLNTIRKNTGVIEKIAQAVSRNFFELSSKKT